MVTTSGTYFKGLTYIITMSFAQPKALCYNIASLPFLLIMKTLKE